MTLVINDLKWGLAHKALQLAKDALKAEVQYVKNPSRSNKAEWMDKEHLYHFLLTSKAQKKKLSLLDNHIMNMGGNVVSSWLA